jgi:acetylornithine deacetylase
MSSIPECIRYLRDYVAIPSVNPMRRTDVPAEVRGEKRYAEHLREQLRGLGLDATIVGSGERASVVAEARVCGTAAETVLIASHLDTVPVDGMEIDPFDPRIDGGCLYGRGSCDTKSGMAAVVAALGRVLRSGSLRRNVILVGEADEECGSVGVADVLAHLGGRRPDWLLATEPTEMRVVTHHKGIALTRLAARGRSCHSSDPTAGKSAIVPLAKAVVALDELAQELVVRRDPVLGHPTLSVGLIGGGEAANIVPQDAWLLMDRRMLPGESEKQIRDEITSALARHGIDEVTIESCTVEKPPLAIAAGDAAVRACQAALASLELPTETATAAFATDAGLFAEQGVPSVVLGPGRIAEAHTAREFVEIAQVEAATDFFVRLLETSGPTDFNP